MIPKIYDNGEGISLVFDLEIGLGLVVDMTDKAAEEMINIIQNKLNARFLR